MLSDSAGSCAAGQSPTTKATTGSGVLTLSIKGNKKLITHQLNKSIIFRSISKLKHLTYDTYMYIVEYDVNIYFLFFTDSCCKYISSHIYVFYQQFCFYGLKILAQLRNINEHLIYMQLVAVSFQVLGILNGMTVIIKKSHST